MKKRLFPVLILTALAFSVPAFSQDQTFAADKRAADQFLKALHEDDRSAVARMITYPLVRPAPLKPIVNAKQFVAHWDEYFDADTTQRVLASEPQQYGWRGIALENGIVWFGKGHVIAIYSDTPAAQKALQDAKATEAPALYPSLRGYDKVIFECSTKTLHVRVQQYGDDVRYFSWKKGAALSSKPALEITGGTYDPQGTGGNFNLTFQNDGYTYELEIGHNLCGETCDDYLSVMQGGKNLSQKVCHETKN